MPRIDPVTGCPVMTHFEFLAAEAEREGTTPEAIMQEIADVTASDAASQKTFWHDPANALVELKRAATLAFDSFEIDDLLPPQPVEVIEVLAVDVYETCCHSKMELKARARCDDGRVYVLESVQQNWAGSRMEPPDHDEEFNYLYCEVDYGNGNQQLAKS